MTQNTKSSTVLPLWCDPARLGHEHVTIYETCERGSPGHCINTNACKAMARVLGRTVRKVNTLKGCVNWSEQHDDGSWHMYSARLNLSYAKKVDRFDNERAHFRLPKQAPFGPVKYKGPSVERRDPLDVIHARKAAYAARVAAGEHVERAKFRDPQAPHVEAMAAKGRKAC